MRGQFATVKQKRVPVKSLMRSEDYTLAMSWTTPEYTKHLEMMERKR